MHAVADRHYISPRPYNDGRLTLGYCRINLDRHRAPGQQTLEQVGTSKSFLPPPTKGIEYQGNTTLSSCTLLSDLQGTQEGGPVQRAESDALCTTAHHYRVVAPPALTLRLRRLRVLSNSSKARQPLVVSISPPSKNHKEGAPYEKQTPPLRR